MCANNKYTYILKYYSTHTHTHTCTHTHTHTHTHAHFSIMKPGQEVIKL